MFDDLPDGEASEVIRGRPRRRSGHHPVLLVALAFLVVVSAGNMLAWFDFWRALPVLAVVLAVLFVVRSRGHRD